VRWASYAGGTHIFIKGVGLDENPQSNHLRFKSAENPDLVVGVPLLTEDDAFNSQPMLGSIAYRLPALVDFLHPNVVAQYQSMSFYIVVDVETLAGPATLECKRLANCKVSYHVGYSPTIFYMMPPILYQDSYSTIWFDPKSTTGLIKDLAADELPFINAKVGGSLMDFEFNVDSGTSYAHWAKNRATG